MAETRPAQGNSAEPTTTSAPPQKASSTRMLILLGILAIVVGAYAHDYFVATPAAKKADEDLRQLVDERNAMGVKEGKLVVSQDVQDLLGKTPSKVIERPDSTVEVYRYWGGMLPQRQYISVLFVGKDRHYHVHHLNMMPDEEDFPSGPEAPPAKSEGDSSEPASEAPGAEGDKAPESATEGDAPASESEPAESTPAEDKPAEEKPAEETPAEENPADDKPAEEAPADEAKSE